MHPKMISLHFVRRNIEIIIKGTTYNNEMDFGYGTDENSNEISEKKVY
jgi:hypothetical protein